MERTKINPAETPLKVHAPVAIRIVSGLLWLAGLGLIFLGIPLVIIIIGVIPILLGLANIKAAQYVYRLNHKGLMYAITSQVLLIGYSLVQLYYNSADVLNISIQVALAVTIIFILLYYQGLFKPFSDNVSINDLNAPIPILQKTTTFVPILNPILLLYGVLAILILFIFKGNVYSILFAIFAGISLMFRDANYGSLSRLEIIKKFFISRAVLITWAIYLLLIIAFYLSTRA